MWSSLHNSSAHSSAWLLTSLWLIFMLLPRSPTGKVIRSAILSDAFAIFPLRAESTSCVWNSKLCYPPMPSEFQSNKLNPPFPSLGIPKCCPWYGTDIFCNRPFTVKIKKLFTPLKSIVSIKARSNLHNISTQHVYYDTFGNKVLSILLWSQVFQTCDLKNRSNINDN